MDIIQALKEELQIGRNQVEAAVKLIDEGNTIPFIARYRKEATGSLNDEVLRQLDERLRICYKYFVIRGLPSCWKHSQCAENCVEYGTAVQQDDNRLHRLACHPAAVPYRLNVTCFSCSGGGASHPNQT